MKRIVLTLLSVFMLLACAKQQAKVAVPDPNPNGDITMDQFLGDAVFYGLQKDAAPVSMVNKILKADLFVPKCPICRPVESGMSQHLENPPTIMVKRNANSVVAKMMAAETREQQQIALRNLISAYVGQYYEVLKFTPEAKAKMEKKLAAGRKRGMSGMTSNFGKFCPSCDGACNIKEKKD